MSSPRFLTPADFVSLEAIDRNLDRLRERGDRGQTPDMFAGEIAAENARLNAVMRARWAREDAERAEKNRRHAHGDDLPLFAA